MCHFCNTLDYSTVRTSTQIEVMPRVYAVLVRPDILIIETGGIFEILIFAISIFAVDYSTVRIPID